MADLAPPSPVSSTGRVLTNTAVSSGLIRLDLALDQAVDFLPGQFAMLNLTGRRAFVFSRPFSILDSQDGVMSFLYRIVGRGTDAMAALVPGEAMVMLGPLGRPFPAPDPDRRTVLVAGGVGLPPVFSWLARYGRPDDLAYFGARDGSDAPWDLLGDRWQVSVDDLSGIPHGKKAFHGVVTALAASTAADVGQQAELLSCGPLPLLKAASALARERGWSAWLSLEEHMGCGYGACKGCVVSVRDDAGATGAVRNATCCQEGPVFRAEDIVWDIEAVEPAAQACPNPEESS